MPSRIYRRAKGIISTVAGRCKTKLHYWRNSQWRIGSKFWCNDCHWAQSHISLQPEVASWRPGGGSTGAVSTPGNSTYRCGRESPASPSSLHAFCSKDQSDESGRWGQRAAFLPHCILTWNTTQSSEMKRWNHSSLKWLCSWLMETETQQTEASPL